MNINVTYQRCTWQLRYTDYYKFLGLQVVDILGDGNCLFRSLLRCINIDKEHIHDYTTRTDKFMISQDHNHIIPTTNTLTRFTSIHFTDTHYDLNPHIPFFSLKIYT